MIVVGKMYFLWKMEMPEIMAEERKHAQTVKVCHMYVVGDAQSQIVQNILNVLSALWMP